MRIGITGLMGSGKSTAGKILKKYGFTVIEGDDIAWKLYEKDLVKNRLVDRFGDYILEGEKISRERMRNFFNTEDKLKEIAEFMAPYIKEEIKKYLIKHNNIVVVAALLCYWKIEDWFDRVICLEVSDDTIRKRFKNNEEIIKRRHIQRKWLDGCRIDIRIKNEEDINSLEERLLKDVIKR